MAVNGDVPRRLARDVPLPWAPLERYLRSTLPGLEGELELFEFSHGEANRKYLARFGATELVVRRPPFGRLPPGAHDMRREHRVLSRLWEAYPRAPRAFLLCTDHDVWGADFVVMERRHGVVVRGQAPASFSGVPDLGARISRALLNAMADLHQIEPGAVGLGDLGRPDGYATRQLAGWLHRWELVCIEAVDEELRAVHARLAATTPAPARTSIIHNDLKLDNCQFAPDDPDRVSTVFDWDMATLGDPLADLGTLLGYWPEPGDPPDAARHTHPGEEQLGLLPRGELVRRYLERIDADPAAVAWWEAFGLWRTAIVFPQLEVSAGRAPHGATEVSRRLLRSARVVLEGATSA